MRRFIVLLFTVALPGMALAQAPAPPDEPETIYSDAQRLKDELLSRKFVQSLLSPSYTLEGQFSRWKTPVCPHVVGMAPAAAVVVERRLREVAQQIGAPLNRKDPCLPNIEIFVTPEPQATLDDIKTKDFLLLASAPMKLMTLRYPVQAFYYGYYRDFNGRVFLDMDWEFYLDEPPHVHANDTRLKTGIKAEMGVATIIVDTRAVTGLTLGTLSDYLALMALAQTPATGRCQPAPSIANLFLTDCDTDLHADGLSDADLAMLTALYETPEQPEKLQWQRMGGNMRRNLEGGENGNLPQASSSGAGAALLATVRCTHAGEPGFGAGNHTNAEATKDENSTRPSMFVGIAGDALPPFNLEQDSRNGADVVRSAPGSAAGADDFIERQRISGMVAKMRAIGRRPSQHDRPLADYPQALLDGVRMKAPLSAGLCRHVRGADAQRSAMPSRPGIATATEDASIA